MSTEPIYATATLGRNIVFKVEVGEVETSDGATFTTHTAPLPHLTQLIKVKNSFKESVKNLKKSKKDIRATRKKQRQNKKRAR